MTEPLAKKVTLPFAPCVTAVKVLPAFSKLSAPTASVITLPVINVFSVVVKLLSTISANAVTVMVLISVSVLSPPAPVLPKSLVSMVSCTVPL